MLCELYFLNLVQRRVDPICIFDKYHKFQLQMKLLSDQKRWHNFGMACLKSRVIHFTQSSSMDPTKKTNRFFFFSRSPAPPKLAARFRASSGDLSWILRLDLGDKLASKSKLKGSISFSFSFFFVGYSGLSDFFKTGTAYIEIISPKNAQFSSYIKNFKQR